MYAIRSYYGSTIYHGVANCGRRPTFDGKGTVLEVHLFDFAESLYDRRLHVAFARFLRDERKFDGADARNNFV